MTYQVAAWEGDRLDPSLEGLWRDSLAIHGDLAARFRWLYQDNPAGRGAVYALLERTADLVGCAGLVPRRFRTAAGPLGAAMYGDFAVAPAHRTLGPALALQREVGRHVDRERHFGYGFPNAAAAGVFRRLGHVQVGLMTRYARVLRVAPHLRHAAARPLRLAAGLGAMADRVYEALGRVRRRVKRDSTPLEWLAEPDARCDDLYARAARYLPIVGDRGREALAWRFFSRPGSTCRLAALGNPAGGALRGYAVVACASVPSGRPVAEIKDFLAASEADLVVLLERVCEDLAAEGFSSASLRFLGSSCVTASLLAARFERRAEERMFLVQAGESRGSSLPAAFLDRESWYLTDADEDW
ncbi:MAG: hypothetical protein FJZ01_07865 [Candidatus Sericytochromatia bacterium]|nr:hypothetical protein [Candidatus Tanganyikabacteria bacterium]